MTTTHADTLARRLEERTARIGVVGLGYVGMSLSTALAKAGFSVTGIEISLEKVSLVNSGTSYIGDITDAQLAALVQSGRLRATTQFDTIAGMDVVVICVPTPLRKSKEPDISFIDAAVESMLPWTRAGQLVVLESTTYPGTTEEVLKPRLEAHGFVIGHDIFLAFSPERVDPGNQVHTAGNIPKVVGGVTERCTDLTVSLYRAITGSVHRVSSPRAAETTKLLENTFRSVNIALANELALACRAINVDPWEVIAAAATKPFGFMPFYPGPGTGGHCIPLDPLYLSWKLRLSGFDTRFIALADEINRAMPRHVVELVMDALNARARCLKDATILMLGVTYKRDVNDVRESPALEILRILIEKGARVSYSDPWVPQLDVADTKLVSVPLTPETLRAHDCAVVVTDHRSVDYDLVARESSLVVDVRNAVADRGCRRDNVVVL